MRWWRLPVSLGMLWAIWLIIPVYSWKIPEDISLARSLDDAMRLPPDTRLLIEGTIWPSQPNQALYDGAFVYEQRRHHKSHGGSHQTDIVDAAQPAAALHFMEGGIWLLPAGAYRSPHRDQRQSRHPVHDLKLPPIPKASTALRLLPAPENWELRLAPSLATRQPDHDQPGTFTAKGFRAGDSIVLYGIRQTDHIKPLIMDRGPLDVHRQDMARKERGNLWLSVFLRIFLSLIPLGILSGLWKHGSPSTEKQAP